MKYRIVFLFVSLFVAVNNFCEAQKVQLQHVGIGYNVSYAPLRRVNEFIDLYNGSNVKDNGAVIQEDMKHIHTLTGVNYTIGFKVDEFLFDLSWTRRSKEVFANYESPIHDERHIQYRTGTLGFGALAPLYKKEGFSVYGGFSADFVAGKLNSYILSDSPNREFKKLNGIFNLGFEPVVQLYYHPFDGIPLDLGCRMYWQANLIRNDMSGLETEMYNHWKDDISKLKSGGSNVGIIFQALVVIPNFKVKLPKKKAKIVEEKPVALPQKTILEITVADSATARPINAAVTIVNHQGAKKGLLTPEGKTTTELFNNDTYLVTIEAFGYQTKQDQIRLENSTVEKMARNYRLSMIQVGASVTLNNIYFEKGSAVMMSESMPELDKILQFMNNNPQLAIELSGHTSSEGKDEYNLQLSTERAMAIKRWLTEKGIAENRVNAVGFGKTKPVADNGSEEGRKKNRRVELKIIKN